MTGNRVTLDQIGRKIRGETYTVLPNGRTTVCQITLENGFTVEGQSACVDPANFDKLLGERLARQEAVNEVWPLEGYLLAERLYRESLGDENQYAEEQNRMRLELVVNLAGLLGLDHTATCDDILNAVRELAPQRAAA